MPDGKVCLNETGELAVTKFAVEPVRGLPQALASVLTQNKVWYLPGVAERFGIGKRCHVVCKFLLMPGQMKDPFEDHYLSTREDLIRN